MSMSLLRKLKRLEPKFNFINEGIDIAFLWKDQSYSIPLSREMIEKTYKADGFQSYVAAEELYDNGYLLNGVLLYERFFELIQEEEVGLPLLSSLGLPTTPMKVSGRLVLESQPMQGDLKLSLYDDTGANLARTGNIKGPFYEDADGLKLLPKRVYELKEAVDTTFENGYEKLALCQHIAKETDIKLEEFLTTETYEYIENFDLDLKIHNPEHIELIAKGNTDYQNEHLSNNDKHTTVKDGMERLRITSSDTVKEELDQIYQKRHITGDEVPQFFDNPMSVLPEYDYSFDIENFSDRVRGVVPIKRVKPFVQSDGSIQWFDEDSDTSESSDSEVNYETLRDLVEENPNEDYIYHENEWWYVDPSTRKKILGYEEEEQENESSSFTLDIKDNEEELDYSKQGEMDRSFNALYPVPENLYATLYPHQEEGYRWICNLYEKNRGGLLADDMGLGKTIQVLAFLLFLESRQKLSPSLIVLPIALIENWVKEIEKFAPSLAHDIHIHKGSKRLKNYNAIKKHKLVFTSYDTLKLDQIILGKIDFTAIICDETQNVKSHSSQRSRALRAMKSEFRLAMTGTPVENSLDELWSIMDFVQPGSFGSLKDFREDYKGSEGNFQSLFNRLQPYYLRRTKEEVMKEQLPEKIIEDPIYTSISKEQKELTQAYLKSKDAGASVLLILQNLRQMYSHPGIAAPQYQHLSEKDLPKLNEMIKLVKSIKQKNEKVIIFTEYRMLHVIMKQILMRRFKINVPVIDGTTKNRQKVVGDFNNTEGFGVLLLSPKAAGVGLTITSANHVIHYTRWWNPAVENQATDRAYRIGQKKDVHVYHLITQDPTHFPNGTIEELMHELLEEKSELANNVIVPYDVEDVKGQIARSLS